MRCVRRGPHQPVPPGNPRRRFRRARRAARPLRAPAPARPRSYRRRADRAGGLLSRRTREVLDGARRHRAGHRGRHHGTLTMVLARRRGARRLILSDPLEERRVLAKKLGAHVVIDPTKENLRERVMSLTRERGADVVCEAVGKPELVAAAMTLVKPTGVVQLVGVSPKGSELPLSLWDVHFREIRIAGAFGRGTAFLRALALMPKLGVGRLITARFPLARVAEAFAHASAGRGAKTVIMPGL